MAAKSEREALRGAEVDTVDLIFEVLTSAQVAKLLKGPLERAAAKGNRGLCQKLVRAGAEIGGALHEAIEGGHGEIMRDLLESGASIDAKDTDGRTPLHAAALRGHIEMVQPLLLKGSDKDALDGQEWTPLLLAASQGHVAATQALLAAGADVSLRCGPIETSAMHVAALNGHVEILRAMIEHREDVDAVDGYEDTVLHAAASRNNTEAIDVLVEAGVSIEVRNMLGMAPLHHASFNLKHKALRCLLKHGAIVNVRDDDLETPLMNAASKAGTPGAVEVVDSLLRAGADETIVNHNRKRAEDMVGAEVEEEYHLAEDVERVRELLANAPADRAWRRRGYLVLCRAHPDRIQQNEVIGGTHHTGTGTRACSSRELTRAGIAGGGSSGKESTDGDWTVAVAKVLSLQEEGIFRAIVGYL